MSRVVPTEVPDRSYVPLIARVFRLNRLFQQDMLDHAAQQGHPEFKSSHNTVFAVLGRDGGRPSDLAARAGITRQSMGEVIRDMVDAGFLEMQPDPADKRAKIVTWTDYGRARGQVGYRHIRDVEQRIAARLGEERFADVLEALGEITEILAEDLGSVSED